MKHEAWLFLGVFAFIFLIWVATGGPLRPLSFAGPRLAQPDILGGGTYLQLPRANLGSQKDFVCLPGSTSCNWSYYGSSYGGYGGGYPNSGSSGSASGKDITYPSNVPGVLFSAPSDYRNVVSLTGSVVNASSSDPRTEYVQISVAPDASGPIKVTDWVLKSQATGRAEIIPKGTITPTSGVVNATDDIVLRPGDRAIIVTGESPVGASFRENKCTGYFEGFQRFTPSLSQSCPSASNELANYYGTPYIRDPACIDYTNSLSRCQTAVPNKNQKITITCGEFLDRYLNYNGCLANHRGDSDFVGNTWRIYLGRKSSMWRSRYEVVQLVDDRGKTVAAFNY